MRPTASFQTAADIVTDHTIEDWVSNDQLQMTNDKVQLANDE
ncbi:MAG: hypothetical protein RL594_55 [Bacteroidota bacterium]|jgi:hypothetical protein